MLGVPFEFMLFALTLAGIALFNRHTLRVAVIGLSVIVAYKLRVTGFRTGPGIDGLITHLGHEWVVLANLFGLLVGFALLAGHFHDSRAPEVLPRFLPDDWKGGFVLLLMVFVLSSFLDNIAAAIIGGTMASAVFRGKVHLGYLVAIVAASNAGGSGSVVGDTTTTMMWIAGVSPASVLHAYVAAAAATLFFGVIAARQQQRYAPITPDPPGDVRVDWVRLGIVGFMLLSAIAANVTINVGFAQWADRFPFIGVTIWIALLATVPLRQPGWKQVPDAIRGSMFLLALVLAASLMPVEALPTASWQTALGLGYISAVFDNIPLTALALKQGGHDWGMLAYAVGFGGSMIWFGSSAGVALSSLFPESRSVGAWIKQGWHVAVAYPVGFFVLLWLLGWQPEATRITRAAIQSGTEALAGIDEAASWRTPGARTFLPIRMASR
ncbi:MAG TPA: citrate transporter [Burkholderiales bacterium]|nr:citrate transporter [Burkholderiales bacterium]